MSTHTINLLVRYSLGLPEPGTVHGSEIAAMAARAGLQIDGREGGAKIRLEEIESINIERAQERARAQSERAQNQDRETKTRDLTSG